MSRFWKDLTAIPVVGPVIGAAEGIYNKATGKNQKSQISPARVPDVAGAVQQSNTEDQMNSTYGGRGTLA